MGKGGCKDVVEHFLVQVGDDRGGVGYTGKDVEFGGAANQLLVIVGGVRWEPSEVTAAMTVSEGLVCPGGGFAWRGLVGSRTFSGVAGGCSSLTWVRRQVGIVGIVVAWLVRNWRAAS